MKSDTVLQLPMEKRAEMAFREAVEEVISEHLRLNLPIYVSRNGRVVELSPEEIHNLLTSEGSPEHT
jgi:demethoxyubiquinone hydroxylase (CLK1/Coq7/Cat5 family)